MANIMKTNDFDCIRCFDKSNKFEVAHFLVNGHALCVECVKELRTNKSYYIFGK